MVVLGFFVLAATFISAQARQSHPPSEIDAGILQGDFSITGTLKVEDVAEIGTLRLIPRPTSLCDSSHIGALYYDSDDDSIETLT